MGKGREHVEQGDGLADFEEVRDGEADGGDEVLDGLVAHVEDFVVGVDDLLVELDQVEGLAFDAVLLAVDVDEDVWEGGGYLGGGDADVVLACGVVLEV